MKNSASWDIIQLTRAYILRKEYCLVTQRNLTYMTCECYTLLRCKAV
jgi:hypothetical protein